jgi:hypothetical protein
VIILALWAIWSGVVSAVGHAYSAWSHHAQSGEAGPGCWRSSAAGRRVHKFGRAIRNNAQESSPP